MRDTFKLDEIINKLDDISGSIVTLEEALNRALDLITVQREPEEKPRADSN